MKCFEYRISESSVISHCFQWLMFCSACTKHQWIHPPDYVLNLTKSQNLDFQFKKSFHTSCEHAS